MDMYSYNYKLTNAVFSLICVFALAGLDTQSSFPPQGGLRISGWNANIQGHAWVVYFPFAHHAPGIYY
jgi:hypothetical protein